MQVKFGERLVGDGQPCFITYEAGPTHDGLESAKKLARLAAEAGADAIKFQILDPERLVADKKMLFPYEVLVDKASGKTEKVEEPLYDILKRRALEKHEWIALKKYTDELNLAFFATVGFEDEIKFLEELDCHSIKIASADLNHHELIRLSARTGMCIQIDTGNSTLGEIEAAVDVILSEGNQNIIIHQCPSGYPAYIPSINLNIIKTLKQMFPFPVAFSDHTPGRDMDVAALVMGANLLEKTITEDRTARSIEHIFSLEPEEMKAFISAVRDVEMALGQNRRVMHPEELVRRKNIRRSMYIKTPVKSGECLADAEIEFRRPGTGLGPELFSQLKGLKFCGDLPAGHMLSMDDFSAQSVEKVESIAD